MPLRSDQMGKIIGWGRGQSDSEVEQTIRVTKSLTKDKVKGFIEKGLTKKWVEDQARLYDKALKKGEQKLDNQQLKPRRALMEKLLKLWPE